VERFISSTVSEKMLNMTPTAYSRSLFCPCDKTSYKVNQSGCFYNEVGLKTVGVCFHCNVEV
jgi:hypothetical protein